MISLYDDAVHGGKREGAGRKPLSPKGSKRLSITLPQDEYDYLKRVFGNVSAGIRAIVAMSMMVDSSDLRYQKRERKRPPPKKP